MQYNFKLSSRRLHIVGKTGFEAPSSRWYNCCLHREGITLKYSTNVDEILELLRAGARLLPECDASMSFQDEYFVHL